MPPAYHQELDKSGLIEGAPVIARDLTLIVLTLALAGCSVTVPQPRGTPPIITRAVEIRERDRPLRSTPGSEYTVSIEG